MPSKPTKNLLVFGETGVGKSTLINSLRDENELRKDGPALTSAMVKVPTMTTEGLASFMMKDIGVGHDVVLWDTVGIASEGPDGSKEPLADLVESLKDRFGEEKTPLWGVLVVVDSGSLNAGLIGFQFVKKLIDEKLVASMAHAVLVGTKWEKRTDDEEMMRFEDMMVQQFFKNALENKTITKANWAATGYTMRNEQNTKYVPRYVEPEIDDETKQPAAGWTVEFGGGLTLVTKAIVLETNVPLEAAEGRRNPPTIEAAIKLLPEKDAPPVVITDDKLIDIMAESFFGSLTTEKQRDEFKAFIANYRRRIQEKEAEIERMAEEKEMDLVLEGCKEDARAKYEKTKSDGGFDKGDLKALVVLDKKKRYTAKGLKVPALWEVCNVEKAKYPAKPQFVTYLVNAAVADEREDTTWLRDAEIELAQSKLEKLQVGEEQVGGSKATLVLCVTKPGQDEGTESELVLAPGKKDAWIGRSSQCDVRIKGNMSVSEKHVLVALEGTKVFIRDNYSTNGTKINDKNGWKKLARGTPVQLQQSMKLCLAPNDPNKVVLEVLSLS